MLNKVLEGCQGGSAVPRMVLAPLTGPQVNVLGIYFHFFPVSGKAPAHLRVIYRHEDK